MHLADVTSPARGAYADLNEASALARHPQLLARERFRDVDSPVGALSTLVPPAAIEGVDWQDALECVETYVELLEEFKRNEVG